MMLSRRSICLLLLTVGLVAASYGADGLKIYISADMEGVVGAVTGDQLGPAGFEYEAAREWMTAEVNTAIEAARRAGATEILVSDSHGNGQNLLLDRLPSDIRLVRAWPRPLMMMEGIDESFDGALFIGYHTGTTNTEGVRAHTLSSAHLTAVRLNGVPMSEAGLNAAIAGHFGVPVVMISGDDAVVAETRELLGDVEGAAVKQAISFHSATTLMPEAALELIAEKVTAAIERIDEFEPYVLEAPIALEVSFKSYRPPQLLSYLPSVEQIDSRTVRFVADDMLTLSRFLEVVTSYEVSLSP